MRSTSRKVRFVPLAVMAAAATLLAACGSSASQANTGSSAGSAAASPSGSTSAEADCPEAGTKVAFVPYTLDADWWKTISDEIQKRADACGVTFASDNPGGDPAKQAQAIDDLVTSGAKAIAISASDATAISQAVQRAKAAGVKIVQFVASPIEGSDGSVGVPEPEFGQLIGGVGGEWLLSAKPDVATYKVAILNADSLGEGLLTRKQGLIDGLEKALKGHPYTIVADVEAFVEDKANDATAAILTKNPDLDLVLGVNDVGALGAVAAIEAAGKSPVKDVAAVGSLTQRGLEAMVQNKMVGGITVPGAPHGDAIADVMFGLLTGKIAAGSPQSQVLVPPTLITTKEQAQQKLDTKDY